jgi:hypothetical protein
MSKVSSGTATAPTAPDDRPGVGEGGRVARNTATKPVRAARSPQPQSMTLDREALSVAQQRAATILEVLAGEQSTRDAARLLGISVMRYYLLERRALQGLTEACAPRPKGPPGPSPEQEVVRLRRELDRSRRDSLRQAALVRATQRAIGFPAASAASAKPKSAAKDKGPDRDRPEPPNGKCRRRRQATVRALRAAQSLRQNSSVPETPDVVERSPLEGIATLDAGPAPAPTATEKARTVMQETAHGAPRQEATRHASCGTAVGIGVGQAAADHHSADAPR